MLRRAALERPGRLGVEKVGERQHGLGEAPSDVARRVEVHDEVAGFPVMAVGIRGGAALGQKALNHLFRAQVKVRAAVREAADLVAAHGVKVQRRLARARSASLMRCHETRGGASADRGNWSNFVSHFFLYEIDEIHGLLYTIGELFILSFRCGKRNILLFLT